MTYPTVTSRPHQGTALEQRLLLTVVVRSARLEGPSHPCRLLRARTKNLLFALGKTARLTLDKLSKHYAPGLLGSPLYQELAEGMVGGAMPLLSRKEWRWRRQGAQEVQRVARQRPTRQR